MNDYQTFANNEFSIQVLMEKDKPWFRATDIANCIGIKNIRMAVSGLSRDERGVKKMLTSGGLQSVGFVSESGLYALVLRSHAAMNEGSPAYNFRRWVTDGVLPTLRQTGSYSMPSSTSPTVVPPPVMPPVNRTPALLKSQSRPRVSGAAIKASMQLIQFVNERFALSPAGQHAFAASVVGQLGIDIPLPVITTQPEYSTTQLANECGVAPSVFGKRAKHLKTDENGETRLTTTDHGKQVPVYIWNARGRDEVLAYFNMPRLEC